MSSHELARMLLQFPDAPALIFDPDSMEWEEVSGAVVADEWVRLYSGDIS